MHRIDSVTALLGMWVAENQISGRKATNLTPDFQNDLQENVCKFIESQGITLIKKDYDQLTNAINAGFGRKRNLNFNPAFFQTQPWGESQNITFPISASTKLSSVGWYISDGSTITSASPLIIFAGPDGLTISGDASSSGSTIEIYQSYSRLNDAVFGNDTQSSGGEVKQFTSSIKYKKVSGSDFTIKSFIGSTESEETIIEDVIKDSSTDGSVGTAYRHTEVNTQDLLTTPITGCGFEITLASAGAFEIQLKNCDMTEGFTLPDFQTYGDSVADTTFANEISRKYTQSGKIAATISANTTGGITTGPTYINEGYITIPISNDAGIQAGDTVTISNISSNVYESDGTILAPTTTVAPTVSAGSVTVKVRAEILASATTSQITNAINVSFDWEWTK